MLTRPWDSRNIYVAYLTLCEPCSRWAFSECAAVTRILLIPCTGFQFPIPCYLRKGRCLENNHQFVIPIASLIFTVHFYNSEPVIKWSGHLAILITKFTVLEKFHRLRLVSFCRLFFNTKKITPPPKALSSHSKNNGLPQQNTGQEEQHLMMCTYIKLVTPEEINTT